MRPIDADEYKEKLYAMMPEFDEENDKTCIEGQTSFFCIAVLNDMPTITPPSNDPLTVEQLREMAPHEWCWIERKMKPGYYCKFRRYTNEKSFSCGWPGSDIFIFDYEDYGKDWLAYRRKPEEGRT